MTPEDRHHLAATSAEAERTILGACLSIDGSVHVAMTVLAKEHFSEAVNATVWETITGLASEGRPVNAFALSSLLGDVEVAPNLTMRQYIARISAESNCSAHYVLDAARQVRDFWALRCVASQCEQSAAFAISPGAKAKDIISDLIQEMDGTRATLDGRKRTGRSVGEAANDLADRIDRQRAGEIVDETVSTGLAELDKRLNGGFHPGELIVIAGRPGMGKTLLGVSIARQSAKAGHGGGLFSLEMGETQVMARIVSDLLFSGMGETITAAQIVQNYLTDRQAEAVHIAKRELQSLPLLIDDSASLTVGEVSARVRSWRVRFERVGKQLQFIVIDYLKFLKASERYRGQRHYEVGEITAGLKALAKDLGIAVVLLVQLNREVEKTADKRPELSFLRESGDIEADADVVLLLFREAYYLALTDDPRLAEVEHKLEIIIAKQRMGQTGTASVFCHAGASAVRDSR